MTKSNIKNESTYPECKIEIDDSSYFDDDRDRSDYNGSIDDQDDGGRSEKTDDQNLGQNFDDQDFNAQNENFDDCPPDAFDDVFAGGNFDAPSSPESQSAEWFKPVWNDLSKKRSSKKTKAQTAQRDSGKTQISCRICEKTYVCHLYCNFALKCFVFTYLL